MTDESLELGAKSKSPFKTKHLLFFLPMNSQDRCLSPDSGFGHEPTVCYDQAASVQFLEDTGSFSDDSSSDEEEEVILGDDFCFSSDHPPVVHPAHPRIHDGFFEQWESFFGEMPETLPEEPPFKMLRRLSPPKPRRPLEPYTVEYYTRLDPKNPSSSFHVRRLRVTPFSDGSTEEEPLGSFTKK